MSQLDRIAHLNTRVSWLEGEREELTRKLSSMETAALKLADEYDVLMGKYNLQLDQNVLLRSQLEDARKQAEQDSATIQRLAVEKREACEILRNLSWVDPFSVPDSSEKEKHIQAKDAFLSRHA